MSRSRTILLATLCVALAVAMLLPACAPTATPEPTSAPAPTSAPTQPAAAPAATSAPPAATPTPAPPAATPTKTAKKGGVLVTVASTDNVKNHYDAHYGGITGWMINFDQCYESLFGHDPKTFEIIPKLAESYELSPDATSITIRLRQGVKWHNIPPVNGREFTSDDVKWNIERIQKANPPMDLTNYLKVISSVETPDKYTVKLTMSRPYASITWWIADINFPMYPRELQETYGDKQDKVAIGTGPFMFKSYEPKVALEFAKNPDYYVKGTPLLDGYKIVYISDPAARLAAIRAGQVQLMANQDVTTKESLVKTVPGLQVSEHLGYAYVLWMNNTVPPFNDIRVRRAISLAIDRQELINLAAGGAAVPLGNYPPSAAPFYPPLEELLKKPGYRQPKDADIAEAKKLLAEAGYANGLTVESMVLSSSQEYVRGNEVIKSQLAKVGIDWQLKMMDYGALSQAWMAKPPTFHVFWSTISTRGDPDKSNYFGTKAPLNNVGWGSAELDDLLAKGMQEGDLQKRIQIYRQVDEKLFELLNAPGLYASKQFVVAAPELRDWETLHHGPVQWHFEQLKFAWLDK